MRRLLFFALTIPAFPQALVDHAAAAAGASIGATAGKPVSDALTSVFGKVDDTAAKAAKKPAGKENAEKPKAGKETADKAAPEKPSALGGPGGGSASSSARVTGLSAGSHASRAAKARNTARATRIEQPAPAPEPFAIVRIAEPPPPKEPALQDLLKIQIGSKETDCIAALGTPSSRISIPEEGHMTELLRYSAEGHLLGTIQLDNGLVVHVQAARMRSN